MSDAEKALRTHRKARKNQERRGLFREWPAEKFLNEAICQTSFPIRSCDARDSGCLLGR
jgi:hypothetical protein